VVQKGHQRLENLRKDNSYYSDRKSLPFSLPFYSTSTRAGRGLKHTPQPIHTSKLKHTPQPRHSPQRESTCPSKHIESPNHTDHRQHTMQPLPSRSLSHICSPSHTWPSRHTCSLSHIRSPQHTRPLCPPSSTRTPFSLLSVAFSLLALFLTLAFFALPLPLSAQLGPHLLFRTLSIEQGLSQNSVLSIARDRFGFLWFGTESGLNKFDGYHFTVYIPVEGDPASISNSWINVLLTDRSGNLWIGTENGLNLYVYSTDSFVRYFHNPSDPNSLTSSRIFALYEDHAGRLWIGTNDGLNLFDRISNRFTRYQYNPSDPTSLSYNQVRAITEDSHGFIWVGTVGGGLNRLDPATGRFTRIRRNPAAPPNRTLPDDYILSLLITPISPAGQPSPGQPRTLDSSNSASPHNSHETLWIGTFYSGLVAYDLASGEFKVYRHDPSDPTTISDNTVNCLALDPGSLAGATFSAGSTGESTRAVLSAPPSKPSSVPSSTSSDSSASTSRPAKADRGAITTGATVPPGRPDISGQAVSTDMSGTTNAATTGASSSATTPSGASSSAPSSSSDSAPFSIWVGTNAGGLCQFIPSRNAFVYYRHLAHDSLSLADNRVVSLYLAPERILWVGTYRGISQLNLHRQNFMRFLSDPLNPASLSHSEVRCFYETPSGLLYVGTDGAGLDVFDQNRLRIKNYRHNPADPTTISSNRVFCLAGDRQGFIWAGTIGGGLSRFNPTTSTFTRYRHNPRNPDSLVNDQIRSLLIDSKNRFWVGTVGSGLINYDRTSGRFLNPKITKIIFKGGRSGRTSSGDLSSSVNPLTSGRIFYIAEGKEGYLWIACYGDGLVRYDPDSGEVVLFTQDPLNPQSLSSNSVYNAFVDHYGYVWVGTNGGGLCQLDPSTFIFTRYTEAQGLPSSVIYAVLEDDEGYIWFSSNRGLSRLDPRTNQIKNFDTTDGLQSYEFNGNARFKGRNGYLYFGGINGFNAFNPREIKASTYLPPVVITNFLISNIPVRPGHPLQPGARPVLERSITETQFLELNWQHRVIAFEFAALDYTSPEKNQYAYILEGFDRDWNYVGTRRFASYSNLPPGRYTFRVKASNSDGLWNEAATSLSIRIIPPFWQTWWFYGLCVLALLGAVYGFVRYRLGQARHRQHELEWLVAQRTEELREANEKLQLLATTDELTGLANYRKFRDFLEYEWRRARRTCRPVSLIICDLDNFKYFNDTYGHQAGDECLKKVALEMFRCCQRSSDLACRYGGDEFAVVLPETDESGALVVAERIREAIACLDLSGLDLKKINDVSGGSGGGENRASGSNGESGGCGGAVVGAGESKPVAEPGVKSEAGTESGRGASASAKASVITACLGVATMNPAEGGDTNELVARADEALYRAKSSGKNRSLL